MLALHAPTYEESHCVLAVCAASSCVVVSSFLIALEVSRQDRPSNAVSDNFSFFFLSYLLIFHVYSLQNSKGSCHFIFMLNLIIFLLIVDYFVLDSFFFNWIYCLISISLIIGLIGDWALWSFFVCLLWDNPGHMTWFMDLEGYLELTSVFLGPFLKTFFFNFIL